MALGAEQVLASGSRPAADHVHTIPNTVPAAEAPPHLHKATALLLLLLPLALGATGGWAGGGGGRHLGRLPAAAWRACESTENCRRVVRSAQGLQAAIAHVIELGWMQMACSMLHKLQQDLIVSQSCGRRLN